MSDLFQDFAKMKILLISFYEEMLKANKISEEQFESVLDLLDQMDGLSADQLRNRLEEIFQA